MAILANVQATVVDIRYDRPKRTDKFLVDTNAWYWLGYSEATNNLAPYRLKVAQQYIAYLNKTKKAKANLYWDGHSLIEMAHSIEAVERDEYSKATGVVLSSKEYRHNIPSERAIVVREIDKTWTTVKGWGQPIESLVNDNTIVAITKRLKTEQVDGYDYLLLEAMAKVGITGIITDDIDFITVPGIIVFTGNPTALDLAYTQKKMFHR